MFTSVQLRFSFFIFFLVVFTSKSGNLLTYKKNINFLSSLEGPMETAWRNTASRHRDNVHGKWPVWGYFRVDQPTSTCFNWHTSISVYLQRTSGCSNFHRGRCSVGIRTIYTRFEVHVCSYDFSSDIAQKITFFQSLARFIRLKHLLLRTLDVNIAKLCNIMILNFFRKLPL